MHKPTDPTPIMLKQTVHFPVVYFSQAEIIAFDLTGERPANQSRLFPVYLCPAFDPCPMPIGPVQVRETMYNPASAGSDKGGSPLATHRPN